MSNILDVTHAENRAIYDSLDLFASKLKDLESINIKSLDELKRSLKDMGSRKRNFMGKLDQFRLNQRT